MVLVATVGAHLRLRFVLALLLVIIVAVLISALPSSGGGGTPAPSPTQVATTTAWLRRLRLPPATTPDPSDTACQIPVGLCVTADTSSRQLAGLLRTAVDSQGGDPGKVECVQDAPDVCSFLAHYGGAPVAFVANTITGYRDRSSVASADIQNVNASLPPPGPLPALRSLGALPHGLDASLGCLQRLANRCAVYGGHFAVRGRAAALAQGWLAMLRASGWLTHTMHCFAVLAGERCPVLATRSLQPYGGRFVSIIAEPNDGRHEGLLQIVSFG